MKIIAVKCGVIIKFGSIPKVASFIKVNPITIRRWIKEGDRIVYKNGFEVYLDTEKL